MFLVQLVLDIYKNEVLFESFDTENILLVYVGCVMYYCMEWCATQGYEYIDLVPMGRVCQSQ